MRSLRLSSRLALVLAACAVPLWSAKPPDKPAAPSFGESVEVNVVNVDVYVTDKSGQRVTGLGKGDFELLEDGKPVAITNFEAVNGRGPQAEAPSPAAPGEAVRAPEDAWNLVILFDNSHLNLASRSRAVRQLREFLGQLAPGDRVMLVTQDLTLKVRLPLTGDPAAIAKALDEIDKLSVQGGQEARDRRLAFETIMSIQESAIVDPDPQPCPLNIATPAHGYAAGRRNEVLRTIGVLTLLVNSLSGVPGRKAVLHVSDGLPITPGEEVFQLLVEMCGGGGTGGFGSTSTGPELGGDTASEESERPGQGRGRDYDPQMIYDSRMLGPQAYQAASQAPMDAQGYSVAKELRQLTAHANAHRVTLYALQASGLQAPDGSAADFGPGDRMFQFPAIGSTLRMNNRDSLQLLADATGGRAILDANNFLPDLGRMREDFDSFYSLGFTPAHNGDGREHRIEVKVKRPGVRLRYRQSYRDKPLVEKTVDRTLAALYHGFEENPLDIAMEVGDQIPGPASGVWSVPVRLRIPLFKLAILGQGEEYEGNLTLYVVTRTVEGHNSPVRQVSVPLRIPRKEVLNALGQYYLYTLTLNLKPGDQRVALAVRDDVAATTSFLSRSLTVGGQP